MNRKQFFQTLPEHFTERDRIRIAQAYWLAKETHRRQKRRGTDERYFEHCRRVAEILLQNRTKEIVPHDIAEEMPPHEIITALIHDCWEDGFIPQELVRDLLGASVACALDTLSKITLAYDTESGFVKKTKKSNQEYYHAISHAPLWVRRIKIADRIDNLKDIQSNAAWTKKKRREYIHETKQYILPIAEKTDASLCRLLQKRMKI